MAGNESFWQSAVLGSLRDIWARLVGRDTTSFVVVDIGSSAIKLLEVRGSPEDPEVTRVGMGRVPEGAMQNNTIQDSVALADAIRALADELGVTARHAITAVPGPAVIIKKAHLALRPDEDLETLLMIEAQNFIPESLENVNLDYQVLRHEDAEAEVLLVAVRRDILDGFTATIAKAGFEPTIVDVDYFALENMFELNYESGPDQTLALVNVGARYSSINIVREGVSETTGDVQVGGTQITDALVASLGVSYADAERLQAGEDLGSEVAERSRPILERGADELADAILQALRYLMQTSSDEPLHSIHLTGGGARTPGLLEALASRLETQVELANPFARVALNPSLDARALHEMAPSFAVAVGMGTRRPGDA